MSVADLHPAIAKIKSKRIYFIIGGVSAFVVVLIGVGIVFSSSPYSFADSSAVMCSTQSSSDKNCDNAITENNGIDEIEPITTSDPIAYKQELVQKLKDKSLEINKQCTDAKAAEASRAFQEKTQSYFVDLCAMDSGYLTSSLDVLLELYQKYPKALSGVNTFNISQLEEGAYGGFGPQELNTSGTISTIYSTITLSSLLFTNDNIEKPKKYYEQDLAQNFHPKNTNYAYVYAHEVGHDMEYLLTLKEAGVKDLLATSDPNEPNDVITLWNSYTISTRIVKEAATNARSKQLAAGLTQKTELEMREDISGYAINEDKDGNSLYPETLAEALTDYLANGKNASELTLEIIPILDREMAKL